jgi:hypothetical protein
MVTEELAYQWLQKTYEKGAIVFTHSSPDFRTVDGKGWEVKPARNKVVVFGKRQVERLRKFSEESGEECFIVIYETPLANEDSVEPSVIAPLSELTIPGYWREYKLYAPPDTKRSEDVEKTVQKRLSTMVKRDDETLIKELAEAETRFLISEEELKTAELKRVLLLATFVAAREYFRQVHGFSPYSPKAANIYPQDNTDIRKYRFARMKVDTAIKDALEENNGELYESQVADILRGGGLAAQEKHVFIEPFSHIGIRKEGNKLVLIAKKEEEVT